MSISSAFSARANAAVLNETLQEYSGMYGRARAGKLDRAEQSAFETLSARLREMLTLDLISPSESDLDLQAQLVGADRVHEFGARSTEELSRYRLGAFEASKTAFALMNPCDMQGQRKILAAIYTHWQTGGDAGIGGNFRNLAGNVDSILHTPVTPRRTGETRAAVFYSISAFDGMKGAGQMLIEQLHARLTSSLRGDVVLSTLSPLRGFGEWLKDQGATLEGLEGTARDEYVRTAALTFLLNNRDGVQLFHMGNGARIGDVKLHANAADSKDSSMGHNVMVNYVYAADPRELAANREQYARSIVVRRDGNATEAARMIYGLMSPGLRQEIDGITPARYVAVTPRQALQFC